MQTTRHQSSPPAAAAADGIDALTPLHYGASLVVGSGMGQLCRVDIVAASQNGAFALPKVRPRMPAAESHRRVGWRVATPAVLLHPPGLATEGVCGITTFGDRTGTSCQT